MLVLSRKVNERIEIGDDVVVTVLSMKQGRVRLGISAPAGVRIRRHELVEDEMSPQFELALSLTTPPIRPR